MTRASSPAKAGHYVRLVAVSAAVVMACATVGADLQVGPFIKRTTADGVYIVDQAKRGREQYRKRCVLCHLDNGQGREDEPVIVGQSLEREGDAEAPAVAGDAFLKKWNGHTARELYDTLTSTMPVGGAGSLTPREYADVLAYLFELSKLPAGQQELPAIREELDLITIGR